jgi:hypothetical protein
VGKNQVPDSGGDFVSCSWLMSGAGTSVGFSGGVFVAGGSLGFCCGAVIFFDGLMFVAKLSCCVPSAGDVLAKGLIIDQWLIIQLGVSERVKPHARASAHKSVS